MTNSAARAAYWTEVLLTQAEYPAPKRLTEQLRAGRITSLCDCGCNSFDLEVDPADVTTPLTAPGRAGYVFEASFHTGQADQLDVILFADEAGNLAGVEVQLQGNSEPVPEDIQLEGRPFRIHASDKVLPD